MTDYNDGKWHGWNGGECPVHPDSLVEYAWREKDGTEGFAVECEAFRWDENDQRPAWRNIIAFRVTKPYVEPPKPIEAWLAIDGLGCVADAALRKETLEAYHYKDIRLFREVLP